MLVAGDSQLTIFVFWYPYLAIDTGVLMLHRKSWAR